MTLDLDDTLWAIAPVIRAAESALWNWLDQHYPAISDTFSRERVAALREQVVRDHWHKSHDFRFLRKQVLRRLATESGYSEDLVDEAFAVFDRARNRVELYPDVTSGLTRLAARYPVVALTNGNADLSKIGLREHFLAVVTAAQVGVAKPDRGIFRAAATRTGVQAEEILHVGDHPELDVAGAARAGLRTAWMNRNEAVWPDELEPPDVTVSCLGELCDALEPVAEPPEETR